MASQIIESVEAYARRMGRLHPEVIRVLQPHFFPDFDLRTVEVQIHTACWWKDTPCVVSSGRVHFASGVLNSGQRWNRGKYKGVYFDLSGPGGMAALAHECIHCHQWQVNPDKLIRENINAVTRVLLEGDESEWWDSPFEQAAIAKQRELTLYFLQHRDELKPFEGLR